jgi:putative endonuclease
VSNRAQAEARGRSGERIAAWWLRLKGWRILERRMRVPQGEIDIIAARGSTIAFVEVKTRATATDLNSATDRYRMRRVIAAAQALSGRYAERYTDMTIDLILITPWRLPRHITDAVRP